MKYRVKWAGPWRNIEARLAGNVARVQFSTSRHYWLLKINGEIVSKHDSRSGAQRKGVRLLKQMCAVPVDADLDTEIGRSTTFADEARQ